MNLNNIKNIIVITLLFSLTAVSQTLEENLLLHYTFDGHVEDSSVNEYHGIPNGIIYGEDRNGNPESAVYFDGIDDFIDLPNVEELKPLLPVSFSFWIKYESSDYTNCELFNTSFEEDRSSGVYFNTQSSTGKYNISFGDGTENYTSESRRTYVSNGVVSTDEWIHLAIIVNDAMDMKIYINCIEMGGIYNGTGGNLYYSPTPGSLGRHDRYMNLPGNHFFGSLDDFMYWDRALTIDEIEYLCEGNMSISDINLLKNRVLMYPNPANTDLNITTNSVEIKKMVIYNSLGQELYNADFSPKIDISSFSNGVYYINFKTDKSVIIKKLIIQ